MKNLLTLMRWDVIHLLRNQLITISVFLAVFYFGIFYLLKELGNIDNFLILLIYNDPVITGYVFAGVLLLFERNQHTLQALAVSPMSVNQYLWSKAIVLSGLSWLVGILMTLATHGWVFNYLHFSFGIIAATLLSVFSGFAITAGCISLNSLIARSVPFFIIFALPFLGLFDVWDTVIWYFIPSYPGAILIKASFAELDNWLLIYGYSFGLIGVIISYYIALSQVKKNLFR